MGVCIIGVDRQDCVSLFGSAGGLFACDEKVAQVDARLNVLGLEIDGAHELAIGGHHRPLLEENFGELIVSGGKVAVDFEGVGELDGRLLVLALVGITLSALEIALFLLVRVAMAARGETKRKREGQDGRNSKGGRD